MSHMQNQCNQSNKLPQLLQDAQQVTNHTDLTQHFVSNAASTQQFAQPVLMATSSGLLLTTALPTVITSHLQPLSQQQIPPLHQFNHLPQQQSHTASHTATSIASSFMTNASNFPFSVNVTAAQSPLNIHHATNTSILTGIPSTSKTATILKSSLANSAMCSTNVLSTPATYVNPHKNSLLTTSMPPPLITSTPILSAAVACVQSKDIPSISINHEVKEVPTYIFNNLSSNSTTTTTSTCTIGEKVKEPISIDISSVSQISAVPSQTNFSRQSVSPSKILKTEESISNDLPLTQLMSSTSATLLTSPKSVLLEKIQQKQMEHILPPSERMVVSSDATRLSPGTRMAFEPTTIDTEITVHIECSKSPILSQPKTIRFPVNNSRNGKHRTDNRVVGCCYWNDCNAKCETSSNLLDHLQSQHVNPQTSPFTCRWANCKVYGRESSSRKWLERHVLSHGGSKLFKCIFEKCCLRFGSQVSI